MQTNTTPQQALEAANFAIQTAMQNTSAMEDQGDVSTYGEGFHAETTPDTQVKKVGCFDKYIYTGTNVTGVSLIPNIMVTVTAFTLEDGGTIGHSRTAILISGTDNLSLSEGGNWIYAQLDNGGSAGSCYVENTTNETDQADDDDHVYVTLGHVVITSGKVTLEEWYYDGNILGYSWNFGEVVSAVSLEGDLTSGYTLTSNNINLNFGTFFIAGSA